MTREEAIALLNCTATEMVGTLGEGGDVSAVNQSLRYIEALDMAISALREQSVPDTDVVKNNAQRIRSMTDEELSVLLSKPWCENHRLKEECLRFDTDCQACVADWLKQPYGGDT